jgi:hypothetical protein
VKRAVTAAIGLALVACLFRAAAGDASPDLHPSNVVTRSGWFLIVWNGVPRFELADEGGRTVRLQIDSDVCGCCSSPRVFNRKRVTITGVAVEGAPDVLRVLTIEADDHSVPPCR